MSEISYVTAWQRSDLTQISDALAFWKKHHLVPSHMAEERARGLCVIAYADAEAVGVATVNPRLYRPLRSKFAFFRCAVAPAFRKQYVATFLTRHALSVMEAWSLDNPGEELQGLAAVFQAAELGAKAVHPQWADWNVHLNLAGFNEDGAQVRVAWFRHARLTPA